MGDGEWLNIFELKENEKKEKMMRLKKEIIIFNLIFQNTNIHPSPSSSPPPIVAFIPPHSSFYLSSSNSKPSIHYSSSIKIMNVIPSRYDSIAIPFPHTFFHEWCSGGKKQKKEKQMVRLKGTNDIFNSWYRQAILTPLLISIRLRKSRQSSACTLTLYVMKITTM